MTHFACFEANNASMGECTLQVLEFFFFMSRRQRLHRTPPDTRGGQEFKCLKVLIHTPSSLVSG